MAEEFTGFTREAFSFWKGLERHNDREWFQAHKDQYERAVRRPMLLLIEELAPLYGRGRLSRINKDMRFAKEKPYKNYLATACWSSGAMRAGTSGGCSIDRRSRIASADDAPLTVAGR